MKDAMHNNGDSDKKNYIKKAARELFFRFGFSKTSMSDIARQCDIAKPTLYYYYKSKEDIFNEIVLDEAIEFVDLVESKIPKEIPADQRILRFFEAIYEGKKMYAEKLADCPQYMWEHSPLGHPIIGKIRTIVMEKLKTILVDGQNEGIFEFENVDTVVSAIALMREFVNLNWIEVFNPDEREAIMHTVNEIIIKGISRRI